MFMPNDVYLIAQKRVRVLWSNRQGIVWIDIDDERALPEIAPRSEFEHLMAKGELQVIKDPYLNISMKPAEQGSRAEEVQQRAWKAIEPMVMQEPEIYQRSERGKLLAQALKESGSTKQTIYRWLRRYWQLGMCKNALTARYDLCGGLGKTKTPGSKKLGVPHEPQLPV